MPPSTTASQQDGSLIHHWISCRPHPDAMPRYEAVVLGRLGRLADRCALVATHEGRAERLLWGGSAFRDWLDDEVQDHPVARLADEVRWPIEEIVTAALQAGEPARTRCDRITDGVVTTWNLVGVPLAHGDGATLVLVHVDPVCTRTELVQAMFGATGQGLMALGTVRDADGAITDFKIVALNQGAALLFGRPASALQWQRLSGLVPRHLGMTGVLAGVVARTERAAFELAIPRSGAPTLHLKVEARAIGDLIAVAMTDVGDIKAREESFRLLFDNNPLPMWLVEPGTARFVAVNEAAIAHYGFSRTEFLTRRLCDLAEPGEAAAPLVAHEAGLRRQRRADGSVIEVTLVERSLAFEGKPVLLGAAIDLTERRRAEARIAHMAQHDALTGLPNRVLFMVRLTETIAAHQCEGTSAALLCLDLDKFKLVNDTLGHPAGDKLLQQAAQRIAGCLKPEDPVARLGGDEFAILLGGADLPAAEAVAERIVAALARPFLIQEQECHVGASIGIAHLPLHGTDPDVLMRNADIALYRAKAGGRGGWRRFAADMDEAVRRRRRRETDLREALTRGELSLAYQPVIESRSGRLTAFEALLRWHHSVEGPIPPGEFVPLAEETGLIGTIGAWVLQTACREAASWPSPARVAVNLSPAQFRDGSLVQVVRRTLDATGLHPSRLELEVTESVLLAASDANVAMLHALRRLGVHIAMDDFGTGYSSLSYLRAFPFDKIKIDRSFVQQVGENAQSAAIVKAVIGLGASLGIVTVAEGIETGAQLEWLREEGCDEVQGYLLGRPMPAAEARGLIAERDRADWADRAACA